jgi:hypothetical protein
MKLPEYEIDKEWVDKEPHASLYTNKIKWIIIIGFLLMCMLFGYGLGKGIGEVLGKEITIVNDENNSKRVEIIPIDN